MEATIATQRIFLTETEKEAILTNADPVLRQFRAALAQRVADRLAAPALADDATGTGRGRLGWWYPAAEYLSDAAMEHALAPTPTLARWLRDETQRTARRPVSDWVGPWFRSHAEPFTGHLETAHLCWGVAAVLDLAPDVLSEDEQEEVRQALHEKGLTLCQRWLRQNTHLANWRGIMVSGAVVAAAALGEEDLLDELLPDLARMAQAFQPDGSYGESLQYGNYLANALMLAYEALIRKYPAQAATLDVAAYGRGMGWMAQSMLYRKPLTGWGPEARARAVNFNDSAALFRPSGDLLLHVAARLHDPVQAGLARGLFQAYYEPCPTQGPHDLASFGFVNDWGFLTLPLLARNLPAALSPQAAGLPLTAAFANGNTFVRDRWDGKSVLAIQGGMNQGCFAPGHLQGDLNSFLLTYGKERLLADPGHSCYRNLIHGLESATQTHNSCTFLIEQDNLGLQEDLAKIKLLEQRNVLGRRTIKADGDVGPPVERGGRLRAALRAEGVSLVVSEAAAAYGAPIEEFTRIWLQCGPHVTFVLDRIQATEPVRPVWNWLVNNQDGQTEVQTAPGQLQATRHGVGLRLWQTGGEAAAPAPQGPVYAYLHDAYHPEPAQLGEGRPGSGLLFRFADAVPAQLVHRLHVIVADEASPLATWQLDRGPDGWTIRNAQEAFTLSLRQLSPLRLDLHTASGHWLVEETAENDYRLNARNGSRLMS
ncbi:hypothetical protein [Hymenobacter terricola]|uniref:hypothetical protein n=1 Tax=Hymenobacter terricola TaxID=2819236 RepID=UPI001B30095D|nr:hypothetical protein [Hymenobacter terricola]